MSPARTSYNMALVGGGRQGLAILEALVPPRRKDQPLRVVGVADLDPEAPGCVYAEQHHLFVTSRFIDLFELPELDIIVNTTGCSEVAHQLDEQRPATMMVLNAVRPSFWEDLWGLITLQLAAVKETAPLRIGVVGAGKAGHEVLQLLTKDERYQKNLTILGVADPNPNAMGARLAEQLGIPIFPDCVKLLELKPDLIIELTGDKKVRDRIMRRKDPHTQIVDHIEARFFWDLLRKEEDRLRSKVESEIKLAGQRSRFQRIFDHLPDPVLVLSTDYIVEEANLSFLNRFRKKPSEVVGKSCYEVFYNWDLPCDQKGMTCPLPEVVDNHQTVQVLQTYTDDLGIKHYNEITMSPLYLPGGKPRKVIEVIKDVTLQKQMESALQKSEEKSRELLKQATKAKTFLETIVDGIEDHMMVIDLDYRILEVNRALLEMVGLKREEVVGKHCYEVSHHLNQPCTIPDHPCPLKDSVASGKATSATHVHFDKEGHEHYYHVVCHPLFDEEGRVHRVVDLSRDITQEINMRTRLLHDDKMSSLGKLSASVVHEINNPLTGILNLVKLMQRMLHPGAPERGDLAKIENYLDIIHNETSRVSKTVSNLLAFSRKTKPEFAPLDLNAVIKETIALTEYQMRLQDITVVDRLAADLQPVLADRGQMKQALLNLLLNAQDAMPQGGTLTLETRNRGREVITIISDTGVGIPKESYSQIFEPFYSTKTAGGGVGLGLSVVYGIVRDHQGHIKVDSVLGQGTSFTMRLPAYKSGEDSGPATKD